MAGCGVLRVLLVLSTVAAVVTAAVATRGGERDGRVARERRVWQVVAEHTDAINACDLRRLMAQHPYVRGGLGVEGAIAWDIAQSGKRQ